MQVLPKVDIRRGKCGKVGIKLWETKYSGETGKRTENREDLSPAVCQY